MSNQKSIIGCGYIPLEMQAVCLKTNMNTNLGDIVYKIITAPYERVFVRKNLFDLTPKECKRMAVDVVDEYTGLTYAVEYEPANLVHPRRNPKPTSPGNLSISLPVPGRSPRNSNLCSTLRGREFPTNAVLHSLRFRMTGTIKHRRASGFSAVEVVGCRRLSLRCVPRTPKSSKS